METEWLCFATLEPSLVVIFSSHAPPSPSRSLQSTTYGHLKPGHSWGTLGYRIKAGICLFQAAINRTDLRPFLEAIHHYLEWVASRTTKREPTTPETQQQAVYEFIHVEEKVEGVRRMQRTN